MRVPNQVACMSTPTGAGEKYANVRLSLSPGTCRATGKPESPGHLPLKFQLRAPLGFFESRIPPSPTWNLTAKFGHYVGTKCQIMGYEHKITWTGNLGRSKMSQLWQNLTHFCTWNWIVLTRSSFPPPLLPCCFLIDFTSYHCNITYHPNNTHNGPIHLRWRPSSPKHSGVAAASAAPYSPILHATSVISQPPRQW